MLEQRTVILRFRDLVTKSGDTIFLHQEIAVREGSVWWGWWHKHGETVPDDAFRLLATRAKGEAGLPLFLFDSGRLKAYKSLCRDLVWDPLHKSFPTPNNGLTPSYYESAEYLAWFSLTTFEEIPGTEFQQYSYYREGDFFKEKSSRFEPFYEKKVYGLEELKQQDRTIWFVRPFRESDASHRIELLDGAQIRPSDFPAEYIQEPSDTLLWTSDLHFGHHGFPVVSNAHEADLAQALELALRDHGIASWGGHIISGDLTWKASATEFDQVDAFIRKLMRTTTNPRHQAIVPCPGNHDLKFSKSPQKKDIRIHDQVTSPAARAAYAGFYEKLFFKQPNSYLSCGRKFLLGGCIPVEIVALNSSYIQQKEGWYQGHGFIGDDQLRHAAEEMGWVAGASPRPFRILVLHHHLMPVTYRNTPLGGYPYSVVLDAEAVVEWLVNHGVDLVLHGHMHRSFTARVSRPLDRNKLDGPWHTFHVAGLSSTGVAPDHADEENSFACIAFGERNVRIDWYSIHPKEKSKHIRTLTITRGAGS